MSRYDVITVNTNNFNQPSAGNDIYTSRNNVYEAIIDNKHPIASIVVIAYNRVEKTKICVECVLKYTDNINYELILIDNGSTDGTLDYFKTIDYNNKKIIHITKNIGVGYAFKLSTQVCTGKYYVGVSNDIYVTKNWLSNLIYCMESDDRIGFVVPMSSNVSNLQEPTGFNFTSFEEMQEMAAEFNKSNPLKWEQRLRLISIISMFKRSMFDLIGISDVGFFHDFTEDDYSIRIRRAGYKLILCGDTFIHHDHDFRNLEDKDPNTYRISLERGMQNYKEKYFGLDAWEDIINFDTGLIHMLRKSKHNTIPNILGVDVKCGQPLLDVYNYIRKSGNTQANMSAFTTQGKYFLDLQTICNENVVSDRIEYIGNYFSEGSFEYIVVGEAINLYFEPIRLIQIILELLKTGGQILFKVRNTADILTLLNILGFNKSFDQDMPIHISLTDFTSILKVLNVKNIDILALKHNIEKETRNSLLNALQKAELCNDISNSMDMLSTKEYYLCVTK